MVSSRRELRAPTLGLVLLMAFPWQFALSAMETSRDSASVGTQERLGEATHHLKLSGRSCDWVPMDCLALSLAVSEADEEGDDICPFAFDLAPSPVHHFTTGTEAPSLPPQIPAARSPYSLAQRLHLRC